MILKLRMIVIAEVAMLVLLSLGCSQSDFSETPVPAESLRLKCHEPLMDVGSDPEAQRWVGLRVAWWDGRAGARPVTGPRAVSVEMTDATNGHAVLTLKENKYSRPATFSFTSRWDRVMRFVTDLPDDCECQFESLQFIADKPLRSFNGKLLSVTGEFERTAAGACKVDVDTGRDLRLLYDGDPAPALTLANTSDRDLAWQGEAVLEDAFGNQVKMPFDVSAAAHATVRVPLAVTLPAHGWWRVTTSVFGADSSVATNETSLAWIDRHTVTPPLPNGKFRMGLHWHNGRLTARQRERTLDAVVASGAKIVRTSLGRRREIEKEDGTCDWNRCDGLVRSLRSRGLAIDAGVWGNPDWAAVSNVSEVCKEPNHPWIKSKTANIRIMCRPQDMKRCEDYYAKLGKRYGEEIAYYEIGNEWEFYGFYPGTTEDGVEILKTCYRGIKRGNPKCVVTPCGWALPDAGGRNHRLASRFVNYAIQDRILTEAKGFYDVHAIHMHACFAYFRERVLTKFLPNRRRLGVTAPWFANETAVSSVNGYEVEAAKDVWKKILFSWANGSRDYIWYNLRATGWEKTDSEQGYGIITPDFKPRPAYAAFSALTATFEGLDFDATLCSEAEGPEIFRFRPSLHAGCEIVLAGWHNMRTYEGYCRIATDAASAAVVDMMGNRRSIEVSHGCVLWPISHAPGALILSGATRAELEADADDVKSATPSVTLTSDPSTERVPDLVADQPFQVRCPYDANPATVDRTWKGVGDCSFRAWLSKGNNGLHLTVKVRDDRLVCSKTPDGDCLKVRTRTGGTVREDVFPSARGRSEGDVLIYDVTLPGPIPEAVGLRVDDDDGQGFDLSIGTDETLLKL